MRLRELLWTRDPEPLESLSFIVKVIFGAWMLGPGTRIFHPEGGDLPILAFWAPEPVWGVALIGLGVFQGIAIFQGNVKVRRWIALANAVLWGFVSALLIATDPRISALPFVIVLSLGQAWVYLVLGMRSRAGG